ncbi:hypothetical protein N474_19320 [Pseudoalteromonas luteoviolacea CPMOR-2]|uniref:RHS repeat-associated core domain-containing protein n=1 Tax=Pseudoalteromonas luteoviolacea TaxID=43657 RepID=UPI0007B0B28B|nr:RHS repeat-associated core domain-containing protein [Pseudoalteromonas luteoviolacea]KZN53723.1 hypothetical protein N474_19320 [Pseudoalteromonas luteoviolacea CPMOR-2]
MKKSIFIGLAGLLSCLSAQAQESSVIVADQSTNAILIEGRDCKERGIGDPSVQSAEIAGRCDDKPIERDPDELQVFSCINQNVIEKVFLDDKFTVNFHNSVADVKNQAKVLDKGKKYIYNGQYYRVNGNTFGRSDRNALTKGVDVTPKSIGRLTVYAFYKIHKRDDKQPDGVGSFYTSNSCVRQYDVVRKTRPQVKLETPSNSKTVYTGSPQIVEFSVHDDNDDVNSFLIKRNGTDVKTCPTSGRCRITFTPTVNDIGKVTYTATAIDSENISGDASVTFTVVEKNIKPTAQLTVEVGDKTGTSLTINENTRVTFRAKFEDVNHESKNQLAVGYICKEGGACDTFNLSNCSVASGKNSYTCTTTKTLSESATYYAQARDQAWSYSSYAYASVRLNSDPNIALKITNNKPNVFTDEPYNITLTGTDIDNSGFETAVICLFSGPSSNLKDIVRNCAASGVFYTQCNTNQSQLNCTADIPRPTLQGQYTYYAYVLDKEGGKAVDTIDVYIRPPYGIRLDNIGYDVEPNANVNFAITLGGFSSQAHTLTHLKLTANGSINQAYSFSYGNKNYTVNSNGLISTPVVLPTVHDNQRGGTITLNAKWPARVSGQVSLQLHGITSNNKRSSSSVFSTSVRYPELKIPNKVSIKAEGNGKYSATVSATANTTRYKWQLYIADSSNRLVEKVNYEDSIVNSTQYFQTDYGNDGRLAKVCVSAINVYQSNRQVSEPRCAEFTIENTQPLPNKALFSKSFRHQFSAPYKVNWQLNGNAYTAQYKLYGWSGSIADKPVNPTLLKTAVNTDGEYIVSAPQAGDYTYQIYSCNSQDVCIEGAYQTVNHMRAVISSVSHVVSNNAKNDKSDLLAKKPQSIISATCNDHCFRIKGAGISNTDGRIDMRVKLNAKTYSVDTKNAIRIDPFTIEVVADKSAVQGYYEGGLTLQAINGILNAPKGLFHVHADAPNSHLDPINNPIVESVSGRAYTTQDSSILALTKQNIQAWTFNADGVATTPAVLSKSYKAASGHEQWHDEVYFGTTANSFYKLNHEGHRVWQARTRGAITARAQVNSDGELYVGSHDKALYSFDPETGAVLWSYSFLYPVTEQVRLVGNDIHVTVQADKSNPSDLGETILYIVDRAAIDANALRFDDINGEATSPLRELFEGSNIGWQPSSEHSQLQALARVYYVLFKRIPSKEELSFMAFAHSHGISVAEIITALLTSEEMKLALPGSMTNAQFVADMVARMFSSDAPTLIAGKSQSQWISFLNEGGKRASLIEDWLNTDQANAVHAQLAQRAIYYYYEHCTVDTSCDQNKVVDSDKDNISDYIEILIGNDPLNPEDGVLKPLLALADENGIGTFSLEVSDFSSGLRYYLTESTISENNEQVLDFKSKKQSFTRPNGNYAYTIMACLASDTGTDQIESCSPQSNTVNVEVSNSLQERPLAPITPESYSQNSKPSEMFTYEERLISAQLSVTQGGFRVSEGGIPTYQIPISLPSGITGNTPEIGLGYSGQNPESAVALGWQITGLSSISRCRQTYAQDGQFSALSFDGNDRYCLDGQRLLLQSGVQGEVDAEYRLEIDNGYTEIKIVIHPSTHLKSFRVKGKDGSTRYYGGTQGAQIKLNPYDSTDDRILSWMISDVYDNVSHPDLGRPNGKTAIKYEYGLVQGATANTSTEQVLKAISYSGNRVELGYSLAGTARSSGYVFGQKLVHSAQLNKIEVKNHKGEYLRNYQLDFEVNSVNGVRQLKQVRECAGVHTVGNTYCRKPITFDYHDFNSGTAFNLTEQRLSMHGKVAHAYVDIYGNGKPELAKLLRYSTNEGLDYELCIGSSDYDAICKKFQRGTVSPFVQMVPVDYDGDGVQSLWVSMRDTYDHNDTVYWKEFYVLNDKLYTKDLPIDDVHGGTGGGGGGGIVTPAEAHFSVSSTTDVLSRNRFMTDIRFADLNGDGHLDIVHKKGLGEDALSTAFYGRYWNPKTQTFSVARRLTEEGIDRGPIWGRELEENLDNQSYFVMDINFDGLSDILSLVCKRDICKSEADVDGFVVYLNNKDSDKFDKVWGLDSNVRNLLPIDANSDGFIDIMYFDRKSGQGGEWYLYLNHANTVQSDTENGLIRDLFKRVQIFPEPDFVGFRNPMVADLNRNGRTELYFGTGLSWGGYEWNPTSEQFESAALSFKGFDIGVKDGEGQYFGDYNADGVIDLIHYGPGILVRSNEQGSPYQGMLKTITEGHGLKTDIEYGLMNDAAIYDSKVGAERLPNSDLKVTEMKGSMPLVKKVTTDSPVITSGVFPERTAVKYKYGGSRIQFGGRGGLGFASLTTIMQKDGYEFTTVTEYNQNFPTIGAPISTKKYIGSTLIGSAVNIYSVKAPEAGGSNFYSYYQKSSRECVAEMNYGTTSTWSVYQYACQSSNFEQDEFGNTTNVTQFSHTVANEMDIQEYVQSDDQTRFDRLSKQVTISQFGTQESKKLGRLESSTVTLEKDGYAGSRKSRTVFTYYGEEGGALKGMLKSETILLPDEHVGKNLKCNTELKTIHQYDSFGNKVRVISEPLHNRSGATNTECKQVAARLKTTTYDNESRYIKAIGNGLFTEQTVVSRNKFGQPTEIRNVDQVSTYTYYDEFGSMMGTYAATGAINKAINTHCDEESQYCAYIAKEYKNGDLTKRSYVDRLGRTYKVESYDVLGNKISSHKVYDKHNRVLESYNRTSDGIKYGMVTNTYNVFDALLKSVNEHSSIDTYYSRDGLLENVAISGDIAALKNSNGNLTTTTLYNKHGKVESVTDANSQILKYDYDIHGNQKSVTSSADAGNELVKFEYDYLGRKIKMTDKNAGVLEYRYNSFGELVWQKDARGVISEIEYDQLGRQTRIKTSHDGVSEFIYSKEKPQQLLSEQKGNWKRTYFHDQFGRPVGSVTSLGSSLNCAASIVIDPNYGDLRIVDNLESGVSVADPLASKCVIQQTLFDQYGRISQQFDDYRRKQNGEYIDVRGTRTVYKNGKVFAKFEAREGEFGRTYYKVKNTNTLGQVSNYYKGSQEITLHYDLKGRLTGKSAGKKTILSETYTFDGIGNLTSKGNGNTAEDHIYGYDILNRLESVTHKGVINSYGYLDNGSLETKDGWNQVYGATGKPLHGISSRSKYDELLKRTVTETFEYDENGNQIALYKDGVKYRSVIYNDRNKVESITANNETVTFSYDANNSRYKRVDNEQTVYYVGALELTFPKGAETGFNVIKRYIGNDAIQTYSVGNTTNSNNSRAESDLKWLFTNYQGSLIAITNSRYELLQQFNYDAFGKQSVVQVSNLDIILNYDKQTRLLSTIFGNLRGYTGHESLKLGNDNRVIHMNGRIYDSGTGRFMQADPFIQAPANLQNYNRYSYVLNNPMSYTDPSGYLFDKIFKKLNKAFGDFAPYIGFIVMAVVPGGWALATKSIWHAAAFGTVSGGIATGSLKGAIIGGLSAAAFYQVGAHFKSKFKMNELNLSFKDLSPTQQLKWASSHALVGGVTSVASGGKFGHGFISSGFTKLAIGNAGFNMDNREWSAVAKRTTIAALVGGSTSVMTGGKFSNGARTAAMMHLLNQEAGHGFINKLTEEQKIAILKIKKRLEVEYSTKDGLIAQFGDRIVLTIKDGDVQAAYENSKMQPFVGENFAKEIATIGMKNGIGEIALEIGANSINFNAKIQVPGFLFFNKKTVNVYSLDVVNALKNTNLKRISDYAGGQKEVTCLRLKQSEAQGAGGC